MSMQHVNDSFLMSSFVSYSKMGQLIVEDTINTWPVLAIGFGVAALCSLLIIAIMRWVAGPIVWLSIIGVIALLSVGEYKQSFELFEAVDLVLNGQLLVVLLLRDDFHEPLLNFP
jgi:hypothetical protein